VTSRPPNTKTRVFLVDDHPIVRRGFQLLLSMEPDLKVCGEADNTAVALQKILELKPDVVIVDLALKGSNGLELIKQLRAQSLKLKVLVFTMRDEGIYAERALRSGADGYITKEEGTEKAIQAIRVLMQGKRYLGDKVAEKMMDSVIGNSSGADGAVDSLSDRELEVLELIGKGLGSREIAEKLHLSIKTIESHREHMKVKLGVTRATELVSYAFNWFRGNDVGPHRSGGGLANEIQSPKAEGRKKSKRRNAEET
jgi:DNA-binding NarL/FixJ family response regulator